ncbi:hypothetical protein BBC0122_013040 [Bartonella choladocola]|uniref:Uncharacterized protein n=1 Tax=Bartonella choladocola TaxID=2750995 RepID=A0A1U9MHN2_9HYPH|nr:hypothetical protein BBC0122_013040 [Bartonella choladocola]
MHGDVPIHADFSTLEMNGFPTALFDYAIIRKSGQAFPLQKYVLLEPKSFLNVSR